MLGYLVERFVLTVLAVALYYFILGAGFDADLGSDAVKVGVALLLVSPTIVGAKEVGG